MSVSNSAPQQAPGGKRLALVDSHHHLWDLGTGRYPWLQQAVDPGFFLGDYAAIRQNYLPADFRADTARHDVVATIHVEAERARDDQLGETAWLHRLHAEHGFPNAVVAHAWFDQPDSDAVLAAQAAFPLVRGIRSKPVTSPAPDRPLADRRGTMRDEAWLRGFSRLEAHGLSWDLRVPWWHLAEAAEVARSFPGTAIVLEHTGFPWDRSPAGLAAWRRAMETLAREPNVHVKVSELGLRDQVWDAAANRVVVLEAIAIFGIDRCMFGSNFPVAGLRIGYGALVDALRHILAGFPPSQQDAFFRRNAAAFYRIEASGVVEDQRV